MRRKPEGKVKDQVKAVLNAYGPLVFYRMPVSNGMGMPGLDFYGCVCGVHFEIETKAGHQDLTPRQKKTAGEVEAAGGMFFAIVELDDPQLKVLDEWMHGVVMKYRTTWQGRDFR